MKNESHGSRILFIGNSITRHMPAPNIGWSGDWGMAASCLEKDYVHLLAAKVKEKAPDAEIKLHNVADFERDYENFDLSAYADLRDFGADILVMRIGENCETEKAKRLAFRRHFLRLVDYLNRDGTARVICTTRFWPEPAVDEEIRAAAATLGCKPVELGMLGKDDANKAIGLFAHEGVAAHPGDAGMAAIAAEIWKVLSDMI